MSRTTIMADALLDELRETAEEEGISHGEVMRQVSSCARKRGGGCLACSQPRRLRRRPMTAPPSFCARNDEELIKAYIIAKHVRR